MSTTLSLLFDNVFQRWRHIFRQPLRRGDWRRWRRILAICYLPLIALGLFPGLSGLPEGLPVQIVPGVLALLYTPALVCAICLYRESFFRRVPATTLFIGVLMTPMAGHFAETFSIPIHTGLVSLTTFIILV